MSDAAPLLDALCRLTALAAQAMLGWLGTPFTLHGDQLRHASGFVAQVHVDCTALWPLVLWLTAWGVAWRVAARRWPHGASAKATRAHAPRPSAFSAIFVTSAAGASGAQALLVAARVLGCAALLVVANQLRLVAVLWTGASAPAWFGGVHEVLGPLFLVLAGAALVVLALRSTGGRAAAAPRFARVRSSPGRAWRGASAPAVVGAVVIAALALAANAAYAQSPASVPAPGGAAAPARSAPMISGDLIVKFRDASEAGRQLADVLAGRRTVAGAAPLASRLSRELGVPLVLSQVTSGREALLAIDREALGRQLLARAGREASVQRAVMTVPPPSSTLPGAELVLKLQTRPGTSTATREALPERLAVGGFATPRAEPGGADADLRLVYDLDALTLALIARLQQRPEVEYAQANRLLRPLAPSPAAPASR